MFYIYASIYLKRIEVAEAAVSLVFFSLSSVMNVPPPREACVRQQQRSSTEPNKDPNLEAPETREVLEERPAAPWPSLFFHPIRIGLNIDLFSSVLFSSLLLSCFLSYPI